MQDNAAMEPAIVTAGDSITWVKRVPEYPASAGWTLRYRLIDAHGHIDLTAMPEGDAYRIEVGAAESAAWRASDYTWVAYVSKAGARHTLGTGRLTVKPNLAAMPGGYDARSQAQQALDDLRQALRTFVASRGHIQEYEIAGRRMRFRSMSEIQQALKLLEQEVAREQAAERLASGLGLHNRVLVRF